MDSVFTSIRRDPKYQNANAQFLIKKLRCEFDKVGSVRPLCKQKTNLATGGTSNRNYRRLKKISTRKNFKKRNFPSYTKIRQEREEFRKSIVKWIIREDADLNDDFFPNSNERQLLRYYQYIAHGIDACHVAPISKGILKRIVSFAPKKSQKWTEIVESNLNQITSEYIFTSKKSVVDFALGNSLDRITNEESKSKKFRHKIVSKHHEHEIRTKIKRLNCNLYAVNPCLRRMILLWQTTYSKVKLIDIDELISQSNTFDLVEFIVSINKQIEKSREILSREWYDALQSLLSTSLQKKLIPDQTKTSAQKKFFDCVASQMTLCLQDVAVRSLEMFTEFMKNRSNLRIKLHILLEDGDRLVFNPTFKRINDEILHIIESILEAVQNFERIETVVTSLPRSSSHKRFLNPAVPLNYVKECRKKIIDYLEEERIVPELLLHDFDDYIDLMNGVVANRVYNFMEEYQGFDDYCELVNHYNDIEYEITMNVWGIISVGFYEFNRIGLIQTLELLAQFVQKELLSRMIRDQQDEMLQLQQEYTEISDMALSVPKNTRELIKSKEFVSKMQCEVIPEMESRLKTNLDHFLWLMDQTTYTPLEVKQNSVTFQWYLKMSGIFLENQRIIEQKTIEYQELLMKRIEQFRRDLDAYWDQLMEYENWGDIKCISKYKRKATLLNARLSAASEKIVRINEEETSFGWPLSTFPLRLETHEKLMPYKKLFDAGQDFIEKKNQWLKSQVGSHDPMSIDRNIEETCNDLIVLNQHFDEHSQSKRLADDVKIIIDEFKINMPVIQNLGNPGLKVRHWEQISEMVGFPILVTPELTLERIIEFGLEDYIARFEKISESATKENSLELEMSNMMIEWQDVIFQINEYSDAGTYLLGDINSIQTLLDDHLIKTQTMKNSPYIKPFEKEILFWEYKLISLQDILDEWLSVQDNWMYLEPIFSSPDIQQQMPEEGRRFLAVDKIWKEIIRQAHADPAVMSVIEIEKMLEKLKKTSGLLEIIQKGLSAYLETKRLYFPRFFFLSNAGLLQILAETKDPKKVQPYLKKCFNGIDSMEFNSSNEVTTLKSFIGEEIELIRCVPTVAAKGQVEKWLLELERLMKDTISANIRKVYEKMNSQTFEDWVSEWSMQSVHTAFLIRQTDEIECSLKSASENKTCLKSREAELEIKIEIISSMLSEIMSKATRNSLRSFLLVLNQQKCMLHNMINKNVSSLDDFEWFSHMRYYFERDTISIQLLNSSRTYGFEYICQKSVFALTPKTSHYFRSIFIALGNRFGIALQGLTAVGKSELVQSLAGALATYFVMFGCNIDLNCKVIIDFLKGMIACGSWLCLDNFDSVKENVMSVIANQIQMIREASQHTVQFGGLSMKPNSNFAIFVTLSSSYYEKMPESLKSIFRPISLMKPDLEYVACTELMCIGFKSAMSLGSKINSILYLCKRQFVPEKSQHLGIRTIKTILEYCQRLKIKNTQTEDQIVVVAVKNALKGVLNNKESNMLDSILNNILPGAHEKSERLLNVHFREAVLEACTRENLCESEYFIEKVHQLYETLQVRSGTMIIGETMSGKTSIRKILETALSILEEKLLLNETRAISTIINPRSMTIQQLYGQFEATTNEWHDGVFPIHLKKMLAHKLICHKWIIFDGPIENIWMESLSSVLDDNPKLCLMSGDTIHLNNSVNLFFESLDLKWASPSIVSRCGIIAMCTKSLGWKPMFYSWQANISKAIEILSDYDLSSLFLRFCPILLHFIRCATDQTLLPTSDASIISALLNLFECTLYDNFKEKSRNTINEIDIRSQIEGLFFFSSIYSIGAPLNEAGRTSFSELFHGLLMKEFPVEFYQRFNIPDDLRIPPLQRAFIFTMPKTGIVFDYRFIPEGKGKWKLWSDEFASQIPRDISVDQIIITTEETVRIHALLDLMIRYGKAPLIVGATGTGKTIYICDYLSRKIDKNVYTCININFSFGTVADQVQNIVMNRLDKRRKDVYGPPLGKKCIIFVDNLCMPEQENGTDTQSAIELLQTWIDHKTWYDQKDHVSIKLIDLQIVCAMQPPQLIDKSVSPRFLCHFNPIAINEFNNDVLKSIFSKIILWHLDARGFSKEFDPCIDEVVLGTLSVFNAIKKKLLPTPEKSHYIFNVRDFSRVIQGVLLSVPETTEGIDAMRRLWIHEIHRVYSDRLVNESDQKWLLKLIIDVVEEQLHTLQRDLCSRFISSTEEITPDTMRKLMYCDFTNPKADTKNYQEVEDLDELRYVVESYLVEFDNMSKRPMNLTMFQYAVEHVSRICRILKQPRSHALLIGVGGSGRQSYTRIAAHIMDYELYQIELTRNYSYSDWSVFLKEMLIKVSGSESHAVFLFTDAQIKFHRFLDDISNLLESGEILHLFDADERIDICKKMFVIDRQRDKSLQTDGSNTALYTLFISLIRQQLHVVLCFSPINDKYRDIIRNYPCFINSCTINWLHTWPNDALFSITHRFLTTDVEFLTNHEQNVAIGMFAEFHSSTLSLAKRISIDRRLQIHIPPKMFIDSINIFKEKLMKKKNELEEKIGQYHVGVRQIKESEEQIIAMQKSIVVLEPECKIIAEKLASKICDVQAAQEAVDEQTELVRKDEEAVSDISSQVNDLAEHCRNIMEDTLPQISDAEKSLSSLTSADIATIRTMKNPPMAVKTILETICILRDIKTEKMSNTTDEYWSVSKKMLNDPKFIENLLKFEKDSIADHISERLHSKISMSDAFDVDKIKMISVACELLCKWVNAIAKYDRALKISLPKRRELNEVEKVRDATVAELNNKLDTLRQLKENLAILNKDLKDIKDKSDRLKVENERCGKRLQRAIEITSSLTGDKERWTKASLDIQNRSKTLIADILISSGIIAYLGQFTDPYRQEMIKNWRNKCISLGLECREDFTIADILAEHEIQTWDIFGLPSDRNSIESATILRNSRRWTLIIDPQSNANNWIKNFEKENRLCVIQLSQPDYLRLLENAIQYGLPVLVENISTELDPILDSVLQKEVFRQSGNRYVKLGENIVEYNDSFRLYLTTRLDKPNYTAEIVSKVAILNFKITHSGIVSHFLGAIVSRERPDVEADKIQLTVMKAETNRNINGEENKILGKLSAENDLLESDAAVQLIVSSKVQMNELLEKLSATMATEKQIESTRNAYKSFAAHVSIIYSSIENLSELNFMYQYSLSWFVDHLSVSLDNTDKVDDINQRVKDLKKYFTYMIYKKLCNGIRNEEHIIVSVLMAKNVSIAEKNITEQEWNFIVSNFELQSVQSENPKPNWMPEKAWVTVHELSRMCSCFSGLVEHIINNNEKWLKYYERTNKNEIELSIDFYKSDITHFHKLFLYRCFQPAKLYNVLRSFVEFVLGIEFVKVTPFDLQSAFSDSTCCKPLLFILTSKYDPLQSINELAKTHSIDRKNLKIWSLGQGQNLFMQFIEEALKSGFWIVLQNCHQDKDHQWFPILERICNNLTPDTTHPDFRLWLTSHPITTFPISVLRRSIKLINETPTQLRGILKKVLQSSEAVELLQTSLNPTYMRKIIFALSYFHAAAIERRNFKAFGWIVPYDFDENNLWIGINLLSEFTKISETISNKSIKFVIAEDIYGGHSSNVNDSRCLITLNDYFCSETAFHERYEFNECSPGEFSDHDTLMKYIESMSDRTDAAAFGLHPNGNLLRERKESNFILQKLSWNKISGIEFSGIDPMSSNTIEILQNIPQHFENPMSDTTNIDDPLINVQQQEMMQFNHLILNMKTTLGQIISATRGDIVLSRNIETVAKEITNFRVPSIWLLKAYSNSKNIGQFMKDLRHKFQFFEEWSTKSIGSIFWLPAFNFPQSFLTGILLNHSRKFNIAFDRLGLENLIIDSISDHKCNNCETEHGYCIEGLYMSGGAWNSREHHLVNQNSYILFEKMPKIHMRAVERDSLSHKSDMMYDCPILRVSSQRKKFIASVNIPCSGEFSAKYWIIQGCVIMCHPYDPNIDYA